jgi:hypothetical protein
MTREIRDQFIGVLAREGGERAVKYFIRGWEYPSQSDIEAAHNRAVREVIESERFRALPPLERLAALCSWLQPATQKMPRNARALCPGYAEAEDVWEAAWEAALQELPRELVHLLNDHLRFWAYRLWALKREPKAELTVDAGPYQVKLFREARDAWWASLQHGDQIFVSPTYLRAGHLSSASLSLQTRNYVDDAGRPVVVILVDHKGLCSRSSNCPLPAAMEFYFSTEGWRGTPWRVGVVPDEALLPPVGEWKVRQGDMVFQLLTSSPREIDGLPEASPPEWTHSHRPEGVVRWVQSRWGIEGVVEGSEVRLYHSEHPQARVWLSGVSGPLLLVACPAQGMTQYVPRRSQLD